MAHYVPPSEKMGGHVLPIPHQIAPITVTSLHKGGGFKPISQCFGVRLLDTVEKLCECWS